MVNLSATYCLCRAKSCYLAVLVSKISQSSSPIAGSSCNRRLLCLPLWAKHPTCVQPGRCPPIAKVGGLIFYGRHSRATTGLFSRAIRFSYGRLSGWRTIEQIYEAVHFIEKRSEFKGKACPIESLQRGTFFQERSKGRLFQEAHLTLLDTTVSHARHPA